MTTLASGAAAAEPARPASAAWHGEAPAPAAWQQREPSATWPGAPAEWPGAGVVRGRESVEVRGPCQLTAFGNASIVVYGPCEIHAFDDASVTVLPLEAPDVPA